MQAQHYAEHGQEIGNFLGERIYETIVEEGTTYVFDRIAEADDDGCPLSQLNTEEILINPGLIYRRKK